VNYFISVLFFIVSSVMVRVFVIVTPLSTMGYTSVASVF